ncbi:MULTISPECIES: hypothetical protein, partial [unclassified Lysobacter]|uniref:hypothetical protein n=1 Tax=unclassified Lysobacter TaxID=2635362 RepID=UPI0006F92E04
MRRNGPRDLMVACMAFSLISLSARAQTPSVADPVADMTDETFVVSDIRVDGLRRIADGTLFTYLPIERGDTMDGAKAGDAIRALYKTGFFED